MSRIREYSEAMTSFAAEIGTSGRVRTTGAGTTGPIDDAGARFVNPPVGIVKHDVAEMIVEVRSGTAVRDLLSAVAERGQTVALPDRGGTVGGALAVGRSSVLRLGHGLVRDCLLEARVVMADGTIVTAGGPTVKNVSGFDLCRVLVGSWGALAQIGEVICRTRPLPPQRWWIVTDRSPREVGTIVFRPSAVLFDGVRCHVCIEGTESENEAHRSLLGGTRVDGPPALATHRWSLTSSEALAHARAGTFGPPGSYHVEVGVGIVHAAVPQPHRPREAGAEAVAGRLKRSFDPDHRFVDLP